MEDQSFWSLRARINCVLILAEEIGTIVRVMELRKDQLETLRAGPHPRGGDYYHPQMVSLAPKGLGINWVYNGHTVRLIPPAEEFRA